MFLWLGEDQIKDWDRCYACRHWDDCYTPAHRKALERFIWIVMPIATAIDVLIVVAAVKLLCR